MGLALQYNCIVEESAPLDGQGLNFVHVLQSEQC